jgi:hypothetical protein
MIGSTVRLGFDATAVQKGLGGLGGLFGRMGRQIGIGGLRQVGAQITDLIGRAFLAVPQAQKEMMDWAGNMTDMAAQTGVSIQSLLVMEEALRMTGASAADTSRIMSVFKDNLFEASQGAEAQKTALNKLGFSAQDFKDMNIDEAFYTIGKAVSELGPDFEGLEGIMADLFGARMGYKMIRFFRDFQGSMATAKKNVSGFSDVSDRMFAGFDNISDIMGRWSNTRRNLMMAFSGGMAGDQGIELAGEGLDLLFDKLNSLAPAMRDFGQQMMKGTMKAIEVLSNQGIMESIGDLFKNVGKSIGEGIMESIKGSISPGGMIKGLFSSNNSSDPLLKENQKQTGYLAKIQRDGVTARYA